MDTSYFAAKEAHMHTLKQTLLWGGGFVVLPALVFAQVTYNDRYQACENALKHDGMSDSDIQRRCTVCATDPSLSMCPSTGESGGSSSRSGYSSSSSGRYGGGSNQESNNYQYKYDDFATCLVKQVRPISGRGGNVFYHNRCQRELGLDGVCASLGWANPSGSDRISLSPGEQRDVICKE